MSKINDFYDALVAAGIPIFSVSGNGPTVGTGGCTITYNGASGGQIAAAEALCAGFNWTEDPPLNTLVLVRDDGAGGDLDTGTLVGAIYVTPMRSGAFQGGLQLLVQNPVAFDGSENAGEVGIGELDCGTKLLQWTGDGHIRIGPFASAVSQLMGTNSTGYAQSYEDVDAVLSLVDGEMTFTIREGQIEDGAVTRYKIANGAVGYEQLDAALGAGDVAGPSSAVDGELAAFNGTGGKTIKKSFAKFSGPATTTKTFTLPNASATILTDSAAVTVAQGGSGRATGTTAYALVATGTTATGAQQTLANGATTEILVGGGASALPVWTAATGTGAPVRATSPALVTPALGTPASGVLTNCTGLPVAGGGTGLATLTAHAVQLGNGTSAPTQLSVGATGKLLTGVTSGDPAWTNPKPTSLTAVGCRAHRVTNQAGVMNLAVTPIDLNVEAYDTDGFHDNSTNPSRITIPSGFDGLYVINCQVYANFASGIQAINVYILLNGGVVGVASLAAGGLVFAGIQKKLAAADYVQLAILHGVGSTQSFQPSSDYHCSLAVVYCGAA